MYHPYEFYQNSLFSEPSFYKKEMEILKEKGIKINTVFLESQDNASLKENGQAVFQLMASETSGSYFSLNSTSISSELPKIITRFIIEDIGEMFDLKKELINALERSYV